MAFSGLQKTRLGIIAIARSLYGSFAGKKEKPTDIGPGFGVASTINNDGVGKEGLISNSGIGKEGLIVDGFGVASVISNNGIGREGLINNDGIGREGEI